MPSDPNRLVASNLAMRFGRNRLFKEVSFTAEPGRPMAILGRNGSGKSTLLKILAGVMEPSDGEASLWVDGVRVVGAEMPFRIGFVAPYLRLYDAFSAIENLAFLAQARGMSGVDESIRAVLSNVGLEERASDRLSAYSTGMKQRVRVAAALLHNPEVLLLDEPSATLDASGRNLIEEIVADDSRIVVVATNDQDEAKWCSDRLELT